MEPLFHVHSPWTTGVEGMAVAPPPHPIRLTNMIEATARRTTLGPFTIRQLRTSTTFHCIGEQHMWLFVMTTDYSVVSDMQCLYTGLHLVFTSQSIHPNTPARALSRWGVRLASELFVAPPRTTNLKPENLSTLNHGRARIYAGHIRHALIERGFSHAINAGTKSLPL